MKTTKILCNFIKEENWEGIITFSLEEETKDLFSSWLNSKSNELEINTLIQKIPNNYLEPLIINYHSDLVGILISNFKPEYSELAYNILKKEMKKNLDDILPLLNIKLIKIIIESLVQEKSLEESNSYLYIKCVEKDTYNYKNISLKIFRSKHKFFNISHMLNKICNFSEKREEIKILIREIVGEMCSYMSTLDETSVLPILSRVMLLIYNTEDKVSITKEALKFKFPEVFPNSLYSVFIEGKSSPLGFIEQLDKKMTYDEYFIPSVIDEMKNKENSQKILSKSAENMFIKKNKNFLILKSFSKIKDHPLNKAWNFMLKYLKNSIIKEIISTQKSQNFVNIAKKMNYVPKTSNFLDISINFEESMDIICSTIKEVYKNKEEIISDDPNKYTSIMLYIMNIISSTYNIDNKEQTLFRSVLTFLDEDLREFIIKECIFDPLDEKNMQNGQIIS